MSKLIWKPGIFILMVVVFSTSCSTGDDKSNEKDNKKKDSVTTDEADLPVIEEVEMEYNYEVTNLKTKKTQMMSQEEYLASGIWENPDVVIKEVPSVK